VKEKTSPVKLSSLQSQTPLIGTGLQLAIQQTAAPQPDAKRMPKQPSPRSRDSTPGAVIARPAASSVLDAVTDAPSAFLTAIVAEVMVRPASAPAPSRSTFRDFRLDPQFDRQRQIDEDDRKMVEDNAAAALPSRRDRNLSARPNVQGGRGAAFRAQPYTEGSSTRSRSVADQRRPIGGGSASRRPKGHGKSKPTEDELAEQRRLGRDWADELNARRTN
jgi:hypothetical protein